MLGVLWWWWKERQNSCVFFIQVFFHEHSRFTEQQGKGEAISSSPLYHFWLLHKHLIATPHDLICKLVFHFCVAKNSVDEDEDWHRGVAVIGMAGEISLSDMMKEGTLSIHGSFSMIFLIINCMQLQSHQMTLSVPP